VPIEWNFVFIAINVYWIVRLGLERRPVHLTAEEQRLRELSFPSLTPREALKLFKTGIWETLEPGMSLVEELGEGQFVGEIDTRADEAADIDVLLRTQARVMCWDRTQLRDFLKERPDVSLALERSRGGAVTDAAGGRTRAARPPR
jgi:CRP-like cAMP-binding protein